MMRALPALAFFALVLACGPGGGDTPPTLESLFPAAGDVTGWTEDASLGEAGVQIARTDLEVTGLVNGDADPFIARGLAAFGIEYYARDAYRADFRIWQMDSATIAQDTYDFLPGYGVYEGNTWTDVPGIAEAARIADTGGSHWLNARQGAYILEAKISPKDEPSRADLEALVKASVAKMP